jgi:hypothetical protein
MEQGLLIRDAFPENPGHAPQGLYLFKAGDQHHLSATVRVDPLPEALTSQLPEGAKSYLLQWVAEDGKHRRSVFVEA